MRFLKGLVSRLFFSGRKCTCCGGEVDHRVAYAEFNRAKAVEQRSAAIREARNTEALLHSQVRVLRGAN